LEQLPTCTLIYLVVFFFKDIFKGYSMSKNDLHVFGTLECPL